MAKARHGLSRLLGIEEAIAARENETKIIRNELQLLNESKDKFRNN